MHPVGARPQPAASHRSVEKLVEYRTAHYSAHSEGATYFTNHPAHVQFRFSNPIICRLLRGRKVMSVGGSEAFEFLPGDAMYVPPETEIDIDLGAARSDAPIECDCFEIEGGRMQSIVARLNESLSRNGHDLSANIDWKKYAVLTGPDADALELQELMGLFRGDRDMFSDMRIESRVDETIMKLLHLRSQDLLAFGQDGQSDSGVLAAARLLRENLDRHLPSEELARAACMSESTLHRQFRKHFGTTPARFANQLRIAAAKSALRQGGDCVESIAFQLGFTDASHFSRVFRKNVGETPAEYRRRRTHPVTVGVWQ